MSTSSDAACVRSFLRHHAIIRAALAETHPQFEDLGSVFDALRAGELERTASLDSGFSYAVHGRGCRMTGPDGAEVDIDRLSDGSEAFDVWRLGFFARSVGMSPVPSAEELLRECRDMVREGALDEPQPGWFSA